MKLLFNLKRAYLRDYLIKTVRHVELYATENKWWVVGSQTLIVLTKFLILYKDFVITDETYKSLLDTQIEVYEHVSDLPKLTEFINEFIVESEDFVLGISSSRPKLKVDKSGNKYARVTTTTIEYLTISDEEGLKVCLDVFFDICVRLNEHVLRANDPRQKILNDMLFPYLEPLHQIIEDIYSVV